MTESSTPSAESPLPEHLALGENYRVELDAYAGPLDLLMYLVKRHEIDLHDIPVSQLAEQYMEHVKAIEVLDVEHAGEFLVMAATLLEIKSAMILPRPEGEEADAADAMEDPSDPRYELVQQLLAYKRFKDAANTLQDRQQQWADRFPARPKKAMSDEDADNAEERDFEMEDVQALDLCAAFARVLETIGQNRGHEVTYDDTPLELHAEDIVDRLQRDGTITPGSDGLKGLTLRQLCEGRSNRSELIGLFLATLELVRQRRVAVAQDDQEGAAPGEVRLILRPAQDAELDPEDTEVSNLSDASDQAEA